MKIINNGIINKVLIIILLINNCTTTPGVYSKKTEIHKELPVMLQSAPGKTAVIQSKLLEGAEYLLGKTTIVVNDRHFIADCINTILAIYYYAGIDLAKEFDRYSGNGVARLYKILDNRGLLYIAKLPEPGDIIFWDNTWDKNGDGEWNDPLTHAGMVVKVDKDYNLEYIHYDYIKGIVYAKMNLEYPGKQYIIMDGKSIMINTPIQMKQKGKTHSEKWLSGDLFNAFGKGYLME